MTWPTFGNGAAALPFYYHRSAEGNNRAIALDLFAPGLFSMTTVTGAIYVNRLLGLRISDFRTFVDPTADPYDRIIESVGEAAKKGAELCKCAWVIDETSEREERHKKLENALGARFGEICRKDVFEEMFKLYHQSAEAFGPSIPGMFLVASHVSLRIPELASMMAELLDNWTKFRESDPDFHGAKSMGPFQWGDLQAFQNLVDLSALIARDSDARLHIDKPLQVYSNFFDVSLSALDVDQAQRKKALRNFCSLLSRELTRLHSVAENFAADLALTTQIVGDEVQRVSHNANESWSIKERLQNDEMPPDLSDLQSRVLNICREARLAQDTLAEALLRMPDQVVRAKVALHRTTVARTRLDES